MRWGHPARGKLILLAGDVLLVGLALVVAAAMPAAIPPAPAIAAFVVAFLSAFYVFDLYSREALANSQCMLRRLATACAAATVASAFLTYVFTAQGPAPGFLLPAALLVGVLAFGWRRLYRQHRSALVSPVPTLVLGTGPEAERIRELMQESDAPYELKGFLRVAPDEAMPAVPQTEVLGEVVAVEEIVRSGYVECLVVSDGLPRSQAAALTRLKFQGCSVYGGPGFCMQIGEELPVEFLKDSWQCVTEGFNLLQARLARRLKRMADVVLAAAGLLLTLLLSLAAALAIQLESPGPVLYRQRRVGWRERPFDLLKFRSMRVDAEADGNPRWASAEDPRITRSGRLLRRLHIDEIPQMINVLKGEMSFIGPRPERPEFVEQLKRAIPFYQLRHSVPPGITGWAQVKYPYGASVEDARRKLEYDLYYILNASPLLDLRILLLTARTVLFRKGSR